MRKVIDVSGKTKEESKSIKVTDYLSAHNGWESLHQDFNVDKVDKLLFLGKDVLNGDMFVGYISGYIRIYKGHLNSGTY
jgi:hypothetical protein